MEKSAELKATFPVEIDLAFPMPEGAGMTMPAAPSPKPMYPSLYIGEVEGLDQLPAEGYALIYFKRKRVTATTDDEGEIDHSADLEIQKLCLPDGDGEMADEDMMDAAKKVAKKMGVDTGDRYSKTKDKDE